MMVGLPESTVLDEINTAKALIKLKPKIVRIYPVLVIKGTKLEEEYNKGEYEPLSVVQAVERCKEVTTLFNNKKIKVIRIGLQNTEEITDPSNKNSEVVAGPFHPAFRQLVESAMWYDVIVNKIKKINTKVKEVEIIANPDDINNIIGHKKENIEKLKEIYEVDVIVKSDETIKNGNFEMKIEKTYDDVIEEKQRILK
jgi:histone acetyltransferase (RNA polymerase elongator complex component)